MGGISLKHAAPRTGATLGVTEPDPLRSPASLWPPAFLVLAVHIVLLLSIKYYALRINIRQLLRRNT